MQQLFALAFEPRRPVRHHAFTLCGANLAAEVCLARCAEFAFAAFGRIQRNNVIARLDRGHVRANRLDDAGAFMAKYDWEGAFRIFAGEGVGV